MIEQVLNWLLSFGKSVVEYMPLLWFGSILVGLLAGLLLRRKRKKPAQCHCRLSKNS